jgi:uncharacterized membrane protein
VVSKLAAIGEAYYLLEPILSQRTGGEDGKLRVLHKTLDILETIKQSELGLGLSDLTRSVELPKAMVYRILTTLEKRGYLHRGEDGAYECRKEVERHATR